MPAHTRTRSRAHTHQTLTTRRPARPPSCRREHACQSRSPPCRGRAVATADSGQLPNETPFERPGRPDTLGPLGRRPPSGHGRLRSTKVDAPKQPYPPTGARCRAHAITGGRPPTRRPPPPSPSPPVPFPFRGRRPPHALTGPPSTSTDLPPPGRQAGRPAHGRPRAQRWAGGRPHAAAPPPGSSTAVPDSRATRTSIPRRATMGLSADTLQLPYPCGQGGKTHPPVVGGRGVSPGARLREEEGCWGANGGSVGASGSRRALLVALRCSSPGAASLTPTRGLQWAAVAGGRLQWAGKRAAKERPVRWSARWLGGSPWPDEPQPASMTGGGAGTRDEHAAQAPEQTDSALRRPSTPAAPLRAFAAADARPRASCGGLGETSDRFLRAPSYRQPSGAC